jgi:hypothetical protein
MLVLVLKSISNSENPQLQFFEKTESKNHQSLLFQKPSRTCGFHERPVRFYFILCSVLWRTVIIYQTQVFGFI